MGVDALQQQGGWVAMSGDGGSRGELAVVADAGAGRSQLGQRRHMRIRVPAERRDGIGLGGAAKLHRDLPSCPDSSVVGEEKS